MRTLRPLSGPFVAAVLANLLPVVWFSYLPSSDGPAHVYNASLIMRYFLHPSDPVRAFVQFNQSLPPNLLGHGVLALLMTTMSPHLAERVLVGLYVVLLPLGLRYAMRAVTSETRGVEFLGLAVVFNSHLHWGFYNFLAGLVAYLFALGYWLRIREQAPAPARAVQMAALVSVLYFCHAVPLIEFWLAAWSLWAIGVMRTRTWRWPEAEQLALASIPAGCLYVHYLVTRPAGLSVPVVWPTLRYAGSTLVKLFPLATYTTTEKLVTFGLSALLAAAIVWAWSTRVAETAARSYFYVAILLAVVVFAAPTQAAGGTLITSRLVYFPLFILLVWLATVRWPAFCAVAFATAGIVLALTGQFSRWPVYERYDRKMTNFLEMAASRDGRPIEFFKNTGNGITVNLDKGGTPVLSKDAWGYVAASRGSILLSDYEARLDYFPLLYRAGAAPAPSSLLKAAGCPLADGLVDRTRFGTASSEIAEIVWMDADRPVSKDEACLAAYGKRVAAERPSADGTLLWLHDER